MRGFLPNLMLAIVSYLLYSIIQIKVLIKTQPTQDSYSYDIVYRIAGNIGGDLNLAVWWLGK